MGKMKEEKWTTMHVHLDIRHFLTMPDKKLKNMLCNAETKESLTPAQVREFLIAEQRKGYVYFCSCDKRKADGSCAGHPADATDTTDDMDGRKL
jgi:hypothetical protein